MVIFGNEGVVFVVVLVFLVLICHFCCFFHVISYL